MAMQAQQQLLQPSSIGVPTSPKTRTRFALSECSTAADDEHFCLTRELASGSTSDSDHEDANFYSTPLASVQYQLAGFDSDSDCSIKEATASSGPLCKRTGGRFARTESGSSRSLLTVPAGMEQKMQEKWHPPEAPRLKCAVAPMELPEIPLLELPPMTLSQSLEEDIQTQDDKVQSEATHGTASLSLSGSLLHWALPGKFFAQ